MSDSNPLVQRVDALLKRHQQQAAGPGAGLPAGEPAAFEAPPPEFPVPSAAIPVQETVPAADAATTETPFAPAALPAPGEDDIPVLTEIVDPDARPAPAPADLESLGARIEAEVLEKLLAELDASLDRQLGRRIGELLERALEGLRADLSISARRMVREAVAAAVARALEDKARGPS